MLTNALTAYPTFYRTYSRQKENGQRENWGEVCHRVVTGLKELGNLTEAEAQEILTEMLALRSLPSGRWLWVGGTEWSKNPENYYGAYNCSSTVVDTLGAFGYLMDLAMQGCGTGAVLEKENVAQLPAIVSYLKVNLVDDIGVSPGKLEKTKIRIEPDVPKIDLTVGDSRIGWVHAYQMLIEAATYPINPCRGDTWEVNIDLSSIRPPGTPLKGFGGTANPVKLPELFTKVAAILNGAVGRQLTPVECCKLIDEAALVVVAGNIRRSAGIRQFSADDLDAATIKQNLWVEGDDGRWRIDPGRDSFRMANHTRVFHTKPTKDDCVEAVRLQYYSGEGAIQWAGEAVARANADILNTQDKKEHFLKIYSQDRNKAKKWLKSDELSDEEADYRISIYGLNPCAEIILSDNMCNLAEIHLNQIDPEDFEVQARAFRVGAKSVCCLLNHRFQIDRYRKGRKLDPIVAVSFTGLFDFFVQAFGIDWLKWWEAGRPANWGTAAGLGDHFFRSEDLIDYGYFPYQSEYFRAMEQAYLTYWRLVVEDAVENYCDLHDLDKPNRCTAVQPAGTKSLLTGASPGWHPPKSQRYIRRITFGKNDPVALACLNYGYNIVPSQSDKDRDGNLLNDPFDPNCTEWLVEIPVAVSWADMPGADQIEISKFSALAQFDFYMQVQQHYTRHNSSGTIELREDEIGELGNRIYEAIRDNEGYVSVALLARFDDRETYPRMPFEPISQEQYTQEVEAALHRRRVPNFDDAMSRYTQVSEVSGPAGCDSDKCLIESGI